MSVPARLGLYGVTLLAVFAVAFVTAGAVVPEEVVQSWADETVEHSGDHAGATEMPAGDQPDDEGAGHDGEKGGLAATGLALEWNGYRLTDVTAPTRSSEQGDLVLVVRGPDGQPVTDFELSHEKELHLIVVRLDGTGFGHVHPERNENGQWSIPWQWEQAGSYRVYAEFVPDATGEVITLSTVVNVAGEVTPQTTAPQPARVTQTDGYKVSIDGALAAGQASTVSFTVARDGEPVTTLEPYLGAYGHLVALREGDLAYLHVHPHGAEPRPGETSGPTVAFEVMAPTPGRYLLYLDFQVAGEVHTAEFVLDAKATGFDSRAPDHQDSGARSDIKHMEGNAHEHGK